MSKLADYGIVLLLHAARGGSATVHTARGLAELAALPLPTVTKLLKCLARAGLLVSQRGAAGGYQLARDPDAITIYEAMSAVDGPPALTQCTDDGVGDCQREAICPTRTNWRLINRTVVQALQNLTLADMAAPPSHHLAAWRGKSQVVPLLNLASRKAP
jgi:FeS assembly SUF system regulator